MATLARSQLEARECWFPLERITFCTQEKLEEEMETRGGPVLVGSPGGVYSRPQTEHSGTHILAAIMSVIRFLFLFFCSRGAFSAD